MSIEALKQALEAMTSTLNVLVNANEQGVITDTLWFSQHETLFDSIECEIEAIRQAIAELEKQEPVAWIDASSFAMMCQDPRFNLVQWQTTLTLSKVYEGQIAFYISPPQRQWVGLTDEEHMILYTKADSGLHEWAKAIEAKLKEKNT
jgi:hypothetical protein